MKQLTKGKPVKIEDVSGFNISTEREYYSDMVHEVLLYGWHLGVDLRERERERDK